MIFAENGHRPDRPIHPLNLDHLFRLHDDTGIAQHAVYSVPDWREGYCVDDVVRALQFCCRLYDRPDPDGEPRIDPAYRHLQERIERVISISLSFCSYALNRERGRFRNFMTFDRRWCEEVGSDDAHGRALWGLATAAVRAPDAGFRSVAMELLERGLPAMADIRSPRSLAFGLLACGELRGGGLEGFHPIVEEMAGRLLPRFSACADDPWPWPEPLLTYANARLPHGLIVAGELLQNSAAVECGLESLRWLLSAQRSGEGWFSPVGNRGWYGPASGKATFDQQPIEAHCMIDAACHAWRVSGDMLFLEGGVAAWEWFTGGNDLGLPLYDPHTGGCFDGLIPDGVNRNQGAESLLAWLGGSRTLHEALREAEERNISAPTPIRKKNQGEVTER